MIDDSERRREVKLAWLAADLFAEHILGQADWQAFRRDNPIEFIRAKLDVQGGPPGFWVGVDWMRLECEAIGFTFEWQKGPNFVQMARGISFRELQRDEDDGFLKWCVASFAREVTRASGVATEIRVRGNRAAYEWHEAHKGDAPKERPQLAPVRKRYGDDICGSCRAKFDASSVATYATGMLPCGHEIKCAALEVIVEPAGVVEVIP